MPSTTVHLVDASPYIFRGYFSIPSSFQNPAGQPVNAVYGFAQFLRKLREVEPITHLALAFDRSLDTSFRNRIYPEYKAQREKPPAELEAQLQACERLGEALGVPALAHLEYEADDFVATLCRCFVEDGCQVVVVSNDKDLAQLVEEGVTFFDFAKDERYDVDAVIEKFGVRPEQIVDYLGLAGDSVDNIPGVKGIGKKTAAALLAHHADLEDLYENLATVPELPLRGAKSVARKLEEQRESAFLSKRLATLAYDAPVEVSLDDLALGEPREDLLGPLVEELGFDPLRRGR